MVLAGLAADGITTVGGLQYLDRGYANLEAKLSSVGACLRRVAADQSLLQAA
jgi:UDP-N-acetylglucosamine 1-carboxyvinyltransferase